MRIEEREGMLEGDVQFGGIRRRVCLSCTPEVKAGDYVLVHAGFAIARLDEEEAQTTLAYLRQMEELA